MLRIKISFINNFCLCFVLFGVQFVHAQAATRGMDEAQKALSSFANKIYILGETKGGNLKDWNAAEKEAVAKIRHLISKYPDLLKSRNKQGQTLLMMASFQGQAHIVAELLKHPEVRTSIDELDEQGMSSSAYAQLAIKQSAFACNPKIWQNPFAFVPRLVVFPYYESRNPYANISIQLAAFNAKSGLELARTFWLKSCGRHNPKLKEEVAATRELQSTLIKLNTKAIKDRDKKKRKRYSVGSLIDCQWGKGDVKINGCTLVIKSGKFKGKDLALAYLSRAKALHKKGEFDQAKSDTRKAIEHYPSILSPKKKKKR